MLSIITGWKSQGNILADEFNEQVQREKKEKKEIHFHN